MGISGTRHALHASTWWTTRTHIGQSGRVWLGMTARMARLFFGADVEGPGSAILGQVARKCSDYPCVKVRRACSNGRRA